MRAINVGIQCIEIYFPKVYVSQQELEIFNGVSKGKYTIGLGQNNMSFVYPFEDVNSLALNAVSNLLAKYNINPDSIGRLEVGTETLIDKSKSTKTTLMRLFNQQDIEGVTSINACYGGTSALFNTIQWMQSEAWDGRLGIVVCADVAVYEKGAARPTGGAGAVAMLITPNARFVLEKQRVTCMKDTYDFYKPNLASEYPIVDGQLSINSYLSTIDYCSERVNTQADFYCFHAPFHKMVQKSFSRMMKHLPEQEIAALFQSKVLPTCLLSKELGNIYTGSLYTGLISLIETQNDLIGKKILMFSYGSGCAASLFSLKCIQSTSPLKKIINLQERLNNRKKIDCKELDQMLQQKQNQFNQPNLKFNIDSELLFDNAYYLQSIDEKWRRQYSRIESTSQIDRLKLLNRQFTQNQNI